MFLWSDLYGYSIKTYSTLPRLQNNSHLCVLNGNKFLKSIGRWRHGKHTVLKASEQGAGEWEKRIGQKDRCGSESEVSPQVEKSERKVSSQCSWAWLAASPLGNHPCSEAGSGEASGFADLLFSYPSSPAPWPSPWTVTVRDTKAIYLVVISNGCCIFILCSARYQMHFMDHLLWFSAPHKRVSIVISLYEWGNYSSKKSIKMSRVAQGWGWETDGLILEPSHGPAHGSFTKGQSSPLSSLAVVPTTVSPPRPHHSLLLLPPSHREQQPASWSGVCSERTRKSVSEDFWEAGEKQTAELQEVRELECIEFQYNQKPVILLFGENAEKEKIREVGL